jgi:lycopene cyclase domain-containing protein
MQAYTYLLINFFTIIICFIASFDKRLKFNTHFISFLTGAAIVAVPFLIWDIIFTKQGIWWFDFDYTIGFHIAGLPIEEWLFFFCIPFSCVFTYYCLELFFKWENLPAYNNLIAFAGIIACALMGLSYKEQLYTSVTAWFTFGSFVLLHLVFRVSWLTRATLTYILLLPGFFLVNGVLTGTGIPSPIVNYNEAEIMGIRMLTIPIEDSIYGLSQFLWNIFFFKLIHRKTGSKLKSNTL